MDKDKKPKSYEVVRFLGRPGIREISAADWEGAGVKDHPTTRWDQHNNWQIKRSDLNLTDEQFARIIQADTGLRLENYTEPASEEETSA